MRYNDETKFHELFKDFEVIEIFEREMPGFVFYILETPLWNLTSEETLGYVKNIYSSVLDVDNEKMERIFNLIGNLIWKLILRI